ncbi:L,D-transpeptidase [Gemmatimonas phototrophica]|uniref:L,D-transpeptidase n=1 Tax=Gemmatimonas phototrophica TaxID=1379270 RepID=UPI0006A7099B|nr:L,D-transpeptidase [Gemmatimonas phototrophica]
MATPMAPHLRSGPSRVRRYGWRGAPSWLLGLMLLVAAHTVWVGYQTLQTRFERDIARLVFNDNSEALEQAALQAGLGVDSLRAQLASTPAPPADSSYLVVSIVERRVWYKQGDSILFTAPVATGSGKQLVVKGGAKVLRFETPRGRLVVQRRDSAPAWIPPDWHYQEQANKRGLGLTQLVRGRPLKLRDGGQLTVKGNDVVRVAPDGTIRPLTATDGREIVADGKVIIPPFGTNQRKYPDVLGSFRLYLGDGYALHGTNNPKSVGQAVSHGCVRLRNEDITELYHRVAVGTPVFIY